MYDEPTVIGRDSGTRLALVSAAPTGTVTHIPCPWPHHSEGHLSLSVSLSLSTSTTMKFCSRVSALALAVVCLGAGLGPTAAVIHDISDYGAVAGDATANISNTDAFNSACAAAEVSGVLALLPAVAAPAFVSPPSTTPPPHTHIHLYTPLPPLGIRHSSGPEGPVRTVSLYWGHDLYAQDQHRDQT